MAIHALLKILFSMKGFWSMYGGICVHSGTWALMKLDTDVGCWVLGKESPVPADLKGDQRSRGHGSSSSALTLTQHGAHFIIILENNC